MAGTSTLIYTYQDQLHVFKSLTLLFQDFLVVILNVLAKKFEFSRLGLYAWQCFSAYEKAISWFFWGEKKGPRKLYESNCMSFSSWKLALHIPRLINKQKSSVNCMQMAGPTLQAFVMALVCFPVLPSLKISAKKKVVFFFSSSRIL